MTVRLSGGISISCVSYICLKNKLLKSDKIWYWTYGIHVPPAAKLQGLNISLMHYVFLDLLILILK